MAFFPKTTRNPFKNQVFAYVQFMQALSIFKAVSGVKRHEESKNQVKNQMHEAIVQRCEVATGQGDANLRRPDALAPTNPRCQE
ncbi:hypothetical protein PQR62_19295 [Herbaspirillum lusitanum]|uniref:Uncharacterized protein n=1 Tax=Herbaspirillum lusitanum TaxID=213312 RepID=A0ABW9AEH3_9BURK